MTSLHRRQKTRNVLSLLASWEQAKGNPGQGIWGNHRSGSTKSVEGEQWSHSLTQYFPGGWLLGLAWGVDEMSSWDLVIVSSVSHQLAIFSSFHLVCFSASSRLYKWSDQASKPTMNDALMPGWQCTHLSGSCCWSLQALQWVKVGRLRKIYSQSLGIYAIGSQKFMPI